MRAWMSVVGAVAVAMALAGCNGGGPRINAAPPPAISPLVGKWDGKADMKDKGVGTFVNSLEGGPLTGPSHLTLNADGTGFLKVADQPEKPVTWKQETDRVIVTQGGSQWVATLSSDHQTMKIDMDKVTVKLSKRKG